MIWFHNFANRIKKRKGLRKIKVGGVSINTTPIDWVGNTSKIIEAINLAKADDVQVLCLPELCITGYGCEDLFLTDWVYHTAEQQLKNLIMHTHNIAVAFGLPIIYNQKRYNCVALAHNGQILGIVAKQFLANDGVHYEPRWFTPWPADKIENITFAGQQTQIGDLVLRVNGVGIGFEICEDAWRGEQRPAARLYKRGVSLILNPSASHFAFGKHKIREDIALTASQKYGCAYVYANLLGNEAGRMIYDGDVLIANKGKIVNKTERFSFKQIEYCSANLNLRYSQQPDADTPTFTPLPTNLEFAQAASLALYDYLRKSKAKGFVLSLSGGADSSACAALVWVMANYVTQQLPANTINQQLGLNISAENNKLTPNQLVGHLLTCAYQGTVNSSADTYQSALSLAQSIGAQFYNWQIDETVLFYTQIAEKALGRKLDWTTDDIALQNIQARGRSPIIWMLANIKGALLLTTSNRSEGDVGYATMDGDTSGSLAPLAGIDKPFILQWLKWAQDYYNLDGLNAVNQLTPTAELRPQGNHQTDETDLMPYPILLQIERLAVLHKQSPKQIYDQLTNTVPDAQMRKHYVTKFFRLWAQNQWKRERIAPSFHYDDLNIDPRSWHRFPILSAGFIEELNQI